jgi:hypothetical protein
LYRRLLRLYPAEYFREYADEMVSVFRQAQEAAHGQNVQRRALFCIRELAGVLAGAYRAQCGAFQWTRFRRFEMRSEFRFSRVTIALMTFVLVFVLMAIDAARDIAVGHAVSVVHMPSLSRVFWFLGFGLFAGSIYGAIGYGVLIALRKTGLRK